MYKHGNIRLRKVGEADLTFLNGIKDDTWENTHRVSILNDLDQRKWFETLDSRPNNPSNLVLIATDLNNLSAIFGVLKILNIDYINGSADVGWDIHHSYRNKGYGKRLVRAGCDFCFDVLALRRLNAEILANNIASIKCAQAAGFVQEGCKRAAVIKRGESIDSIVVGLLVTERTR